MKSACRDETKPFALSELLRKSSFGDPDPNQQNRRLGSCRRLLRMSASYESVAESCPTAVHPVGSFGCNALPPKVVRRQAPSCRHSAPVEC